MHDVHKNEYIASEQNTVESNNVNYVIESKTKLNDNNKRLRKNSNNNIKQGV